MPYTIKELNQPEIAASGRNILMDCLYTTGKITPAGMGASVLAIMLLYIAYKYLESGIKEPLSYNLIVSNKLDLEPVVYNSIERITKERYIQLIKKLVEKYDDPKAYASAITFGLIDSNALACGSNAYLESGIGTPSSITRLATRILHISSKDRVADICCGKGDFLVRAATENNEIIFDGYEINIPIITIATIRANILGVKANFVMGDALYNLADNEKKYDKIFSNFPLGYRNQGEDVVTTRPYLKRCRNYDWVFVDAISRHLSDNGKGIAVVSNGMLWNTLEKPAREHFVNNGEIEAVIKLPEKLFSPYSVVSTSLLVLSKNNKQIRFVDATKLLSQSNSCIYHNEMKPENIEQVITALKNDSDISISVDRNKVAENDYSLDIRLYVSAKKEYKNGTKLKEVAEIYRGVDDIKSNYGQEYSHTGLQVLRLADISDGIIPDILTKLNENDYSEKYITLKDGDIIMSRNPNPVKVAIFRGNGERRVVPSGNLYVIRCDKSKINPSYLVAFFMSKEGRVTLDDIATGSFIRTIGMGSLENLTIPLANREKQIELEKRIARTQIELSHLRSQLECLRHQLRTMYEEEKD